MDDAADPKPVHTFPIGKMIRVKNHLSTLKVIKPFRRKDLAFFDHNIFGNLPKAIIVSDLVCDSAFLIPLLRTATVSS